MDLQSIQKISLDLCYKQYKIVTAKMDDVASRFVLIQLTDGGTPFTVSSDVTVKIKIKTPDNRNLILSNIETEEVQSYITILTDGTILVQLSTGALLASGEAQAELQIVQGENILSSCPFKIEIISEVFSDDDVLSDPEAESAIAQLLGQIQGYVDEAEGYAKEAGTGIQDAKDAATAANASADTAVTYAQVAKDQADLAKDSETAAAESASDAADSETEALKQALLSKSYATGDSNISTKYPKEFSSRSTEAVDNSKYYSQQSKDYRDEAEELVDEAKTIVSEVEFTVNPETGDLEYESSVYTFAINEETGELEWGVNV